MKSLLRENIYYLIVVAISISLLIGYNIYTQDNITKDIKLIIKDVEYSMFNEEQVNYSNFIFTENYTCLIKKMNQIGIVILSNNTSKVYVVNSNSCDIYFLFTKRVNNELYYYISR